MGEGGERKATAAEMGVERGRLQQPRWGEREEGYSSRDGVGLSLGIELAA